jgi:hypothetical protein
VLVVRLEQLNFFELEWSCGSPLLHVTWRKCSRSFLPNQFLYSYILGVSEPSRRILFVVLLSGLASIPTCLLVKYSCSVTRRL